MARWWLGSVRRRFGTWLTALQHRHCGLACSCGWMCADVDLSDRHNARELTRRGFLASVAAGTRLLAASTGAACGSRHAPGGDLLPTAPTPTPPAKAFHFLSPDGTTYISAGRDFVGGASNWGVKGADLLHAFGLASSQPGQPFYVTSEAEVTTWRGTLDPDGNFTDFKPFVQQGREGVAVDAQGNVYLAAGHIYVYDGSGRLIDTIETPERPTQLVFGGRDGRTLFIAARSSLYSVRTRVRGQ